MTLEKKEGLPAHIAIIMDGNGRWGQRRGLSRSEGHRQGVRAIEPIVSACDALGIEALTLFAFSSENWKRPKDEIDVLMELMREFLDAKLGAMIRAGVKVRVLGRREGLPLMQRGLIERAESMTGKNVGVSLNIAFNYGARDELVDAARCLAVRAVRGEIDPQDITQEMLERELTTAGLPPVDLLIRTGGESRVSNFLLYQLAYAELSFIPELWPDFTPEVLQRELDGYAKKERRYGGLGAQEQL